MSMDRITTSYTHGTLIGPAAFNRRLCPPVVNAQCAENMPFKIMLDYEYLTWRALEKIGGVRRYSLGADILRPPQTQMPVNGQRLDKYSSIVLPAANGIDTLVMSYRVPQGYNGVILSLVNYWTGTGFVDGSGDLVWRIKINEEYLKGFGNMQFTYGSLQNKYPLEGAYFQLNENDSVEYYVRNATTSTLTGGRIVAGIAGYIYPKLRGII